MMRADAEFQQQLGRLEGLIQDLEQVADPVVQAQARELTRTVLDLHTIGLSKIVQALAQAGEVGRALLDRFADDALVSSLLVLHGLHPVDLPERVGRALAKVDPYCQEQGCTVDLVNVIKDTVWLRLDGGEAAASLILPLRVVIEEAIFEAAPDVTTI